MSLELYDEALLNKFKDVYANSVYAPTNEALKESHKDNDGNPKLPLISIWREDFTLYTNYYNQAMQSRGRYVHDTATDDTEMTNIRDMQVDLKYQIDVWTRRKSHMDKIIPELILWIKENPEVVINHEKIDHPLQFSAIPEGEVQDNSDIMSFENQGRMYRSTFTLNIDEARIFSFTTLRTVLETIVEIEIDESL